MRPVPDEVLHFSEDPAITGFVPHVAATAREPSPYVRAVDAEQAPAYWFPRDCPRTMAWVGPRTTVHDRLRILGPGGGERVHAVALYAAAGLHLRVLPELWAFADAVAVGTLEFSRIRMHNALPRRT
jgi:hypothetical protein